MGEAKEMHGGGRGGNINLKNAPKSMRRNSAVQNKNRYKNVKNRAKKAA